MGVAFLQEVNANGNGLPTAKIPNNTIHVLYHLPFYIPEYRLASYLIILSEDRVSI